MANNPKLKADLHYGVIDHINDLAVRISRLEYKQFGKVYESSHADPAILEVEKSGLDAPVPEDRKPKFEDGAKVKFTNAPKHEKVYTIKGSSKEEFPGEPFYYSLEELNGVYAEDAISPEKNDNPPTAQYAGNAGDGGEHRAEHENKDQGYNDQTDGPVVDSHDSAVEIAGGDAQTKEEMKND